MYLIKESEARLNQLAVSLINKQVSFRVHYWGVDPCLTYNPVHRHSFFEICYVLDGEGSYLESRSEYSLKQGSLFCSRPMISHQICSVNGLYLIWVAFELDELQSSPTAVEDYWDLAQIEVPVVYDGDVSSTASLWKSLLIPKEKKVCPCS